MAVYSVDARWGPVTDAFEEGSLVSVVNCFDVEFKGEVLSFDPCTKLLALKCAATKVGSASVTVEWLNLNYVKTVNVLSKEPAPRIPVCEPDIQSLNKRAKKAIESKKRLIQGVSNGVSLEGQNLFSHISKMISHVDCVDWQGKNIVVYPNDKDEDRVVISPPYRLSNVSGKSENRAYIYIHSMVEKYLKEIESESKSRVTKTNSSVSSKNLKNHQETENSKSKG